MNHHFQGKKAAPSSYESITDRPNRRAQPFNVYTSKPVKWRRTVDHLDLNDYLVPDRDGDRKYSHLILVRKPINFRGWNEIADQSRINSHDLRLSFQINIRRDQSLTKAIKTKERMATTKDATRAMNQNSANYLVLIDYLGDEVSISYFSVGNTRYFVPSLDGTNIWVRIYRRDYQRDVKELYIEERTFRRSAHMIEESKAVSPSSNRSSDLATFAPMTEATPSEDSSSDLDFLMGHDHVSFLSEEKECKAANDDSDLDLYWCPSPSSNCSSDTFEGSFNGSSNCSSDTFEGSFNGSSDAMDYDHRSSPAPISTFDFLTDHGYLSPIEESKAAFDNDHNDLRLDLSAFEGSSNGHDHRSSSPAPMAESKLTLDHSLEDSRIESEVEDNTTFDLGLQPDRLLSLMMPDFFID